MCGKKFWHIFHFRDRNCADEHKGDQILDRSLTSFGGKGVFTKELEEALLKGEIDMAVHSAKDMPMEFPKGLALGAVLSGRMLRMCW